MVMERLVSFSKNDDDDDCKFKHHCDKVYLIFQAQKYEHRRENP